MLLKITSLLNIVLAAVVAGMYWGPWLALTRSLQTFQSEVFLAIVHRLNKNMAPLMTILSPLSLLLHIPVLVLSYTNHRERFCLTLLGFIFFILALVVTVTIEVPIVKQILTWTPSTLPSDWKERRDKWGKFHVVRVGAGFVGLIFLVAAILFI